MGPGQGVGRCDACQDLRGGLERLKAPEVTLVCLLKIQELEEQRVPEEAGKGGTRGLTPSWSMKRALSPSLPAARAQWAEGGRGSDFYARRGDRGVAPQGEALLL